MSVASNLPIRIYPLSEVEFEDISAAKTYFESGLKKECGQFYYRKKAIRAKLGTIILFQYNKKIIAQAKLIKVCKYDSPVKYGGVEYHGYFLFDLDTVHYYDKALSYEVFYEIYPDKHLGRVTHILDNQEKK